MALTTRLTESTEEAAEFIKKGRLVAFPTETVYGLGGAAFNPDAIQQIYVAKERPQDNPLIVHIHALHQLDGLVTTLTPAAEKLIDAFFPGPLTIILERAADVPDIVSAGLPSIAIRMPAHTMALEFLKACETPIAAPSANRSGRPSPTTWQDVYTDLKGRISCILKGDQSEVGLESTVVDCRHEEPRILRAGGISQERIQSILPVEVLQSTRVVSENPTPSPGVKYKHYAPNASVHIVESPDEVPSNSHYAYIGLNAHEYPERLGLHLNCKTVKEYAYHLFLFFRRCDRTGISDIFCQATSNDGLGAALMDRLKKAAKR